MGRRRASVLRQEGAVAEKLWRCLAAAAEAAESGIKTRAWGGRGKAAGRNVSGGGGRRLR